MSLLLFKNLNYIVCRRHGIRYLKVTKGGICDLKNLHTLYCLYEKAKNITYIYFASAIILNTNYNYTSVWRNGLNRCRGFLKISLWLIKNNLYSVIPIFQRIWRPGHIVIVGISQYKLVIKNIIFLCACV